LDWLAKFREHATRITYGDPRYPAGTGLALAAMAHHRLGQAGEARRCLDEAERLSQQCPQPGRADLGTGPDNWHGFQIFPREAAGLIDPRAAPAQPTNPTRQ
jgi:hypothetical protein